MASTKRFRNFVNVSFNSTTFAGVKDVAFDRGIQQIRDSADADAYITHSVVGVQDPSFRVTTTEASALLATAAGTRGVFTFTWLESYSQVASAGSGSLTFTTNSLTMLAAHSLQGAHQQLGTAQFTFATCSVDGTTNPVTVTTL